MVTKTLQIAWLYLKSTYRDRSTFIFGFALPIIFIGVLGLGMQGFAPDQGPPVWQIDVIDNDQGTFSQQLITDLDADPNLKAVTADQATASLELERGDADAALVLPAGMSKQLEAGGRATLQFQSKVDEPQAAQVVQQAVLAALFKVSSSIDIADTSLRVAERLKLFDQPGAPSRDRYYQNSLSAGAKALQQQPPIQVHVSQATRIIPAEYQVPIGFAQSSPGISVMFAMFSIVGGSATLLLEREQGTLRRLLTAPVSKAAILGGKLLGVFIAGVIQFSVLIVAGQFLFHVNWGQSLLALALMVAAFSFSITSLGILVASFVRTYAQADALSTVLILPLSGLGGAMWPIQIVPQWMQKVALWLPTGQAMRGFQGIILRGFGVAEVLQPAAILVLFGIAFLAIGAWRFKYE